MKRGRAGCAAPSFRDSMEPEEYARAVMDCLTDSAGCRIFLSVVRDGLTRASEIHRACPEIPRATMYRHLRRMTDRGLIVVVSEERRRGAVERVYAPANVDRGSEDAPSPSVFLALFMRYVMNLVGMFDSYCRSPDADIARDMPGFAMAPVHATDEELMDALAEMGAVIQRLASNGPGEGRRLRTIGTVVSPPGTGL